MGNHNTERAIYGGKCKLRCKEVGKLEIFVYLQSRLTKCGETGEVGEWLNPQVC